MKNYLKSGDWRIGEIKIVEGQKGSVVGGRRAAMGVGGDGGRRQAQRKGERRGPNVEKEAGGGGAGQEQ